MPPRLLVVDAVRPKYCKNTCLTSRNIHSGLKAEAYFGDEAVDALAALRQVVGVLLVGQGKMGIGPDEEMAGKLTAERGLKTEGQRTALVEGIQG